MSLTKQKILGIHITINPKKQILEYIEKYLKKETRDKRHETSKTKKPLVIVTPNPEQVVYAQNDSCFAGLLNGADIAIPDGIGLALALRVLQGKRQKVNGKSETQKIPGVEFMEDLVAMAAKQGFPIALIGGRGGVALKALECLSRRPACRQAGMPGLTGWAKELGEILISDLSNLSHLSDKIKKTGTRLVFVGLGAPKQEYFIERLVLSLRSATRRRSNPAVINMRLPRRPDRIGTPCNDMDGIVLMSVGGSFDEISGRMLRAPGFVSTFGLKWLWRFILEPWRMKRQTALLQFVWMVLRERFM